MNKLNLKKYPVSYEGVEFEVTIFEEETYVDRDRYIRIFVNMVKKNKLFGIIYYKKYIEIYYHCFKDPYSYFKIENDINKHINLTKEVVKKAYDEYMVKIVQEAEEQMKLEEFKKWDGKM